MLRTPVKPGDCTNRRLNGVDKNEDGLEGEASSLRSFQHGPFQANTKLHSKFDFTKGTDIWTALVYV